MDLSSLFNSNNKKGKKMQGIVKLMLDLILLIVILKQRKISQDSPTASSSNSKHLVPIVMAVKWILFLRSSKIITQLIIPLNVLQKSKVMNLKEP